MGLGLGARMATPPHPHGSQDHWGLSALGRQSQLGLKRRESSWGKSRAGAQASGIPTKAPTPRMDRL